MKAKVMMSLFILMGLACQHQQFAEKPQTGDRKIAMTNPIYKSLDLITAALDFALDNESDYPVKNKSQIASVVIKPGHEGFYQSGELSVGISNTVCDLKFKKDEQPYGMAGEPGYSFRLGECSLIRADLPTLTLNQVMRYLAAHVKHDQSFTVELNKNKKAAVSYVSKVSLHQKNLNRDVASDEDDFKKAQEGFEKLYCGRADEVISFYENPTGSKQVKLSTEDKKQALTETTDLRNDIKSKFEDLNKLKELSRGTGLNNTIEFILTCGNAKSIFSRTSKNMCFDLVTQKMLNYPNLKEVMELCKDVKPLGE